MEQKILLLELEEAFDRISWGLSAMKLMILGLESVQDSYADGFYTVWTGLSEAEEQVTQLLEAVSAG